jgi:hypothetical protein
MILPEELLIPDPQTLSEYPNSNENIPVGKRVPSPGV